MKAKKGRNGGTLQTWERGESGNPSGRPPKLQSVLGREGFTVSQINDCLSILLSFNMDELKALFDNPDASVLEKTVARALVKSLTRGDLVALETVLSRVHGRPTARAEVTGAGGVPLTPITIVVQDEETAEALSKLAQNGKTGNA